MSARSTQLLKVVLDGLYVTQGHKVARRWTQGCGAILMLHQVCPPSGEPFEPSRILQVTPEFLDLSIKTAREEGFDLVTLDEAHERVQAGHASPPFLSYTLDDGYRDNLTHALPVFEKHNVPFTIYLPDTYADGAGDLWWLVLEAVIRKVDAFEVTMDDVYRKFDVRTLAGKERAHEQVYWWLRSIDEDAARREVSALAERHGVDSAGLARTLLMTWEEVRRIHAHPLATIAAHTSGHYALAKLPEERMQREVLYNLKRLEEELGERLAHFSYPYGCEHSAGPREFAWLQAQGMKTAVTTRKGMIFPEHAGHMTALPRLSLNGDFQTARHFKVLLSGVPFALHNKGRRLNVA